MIARPVPVDPVAAPSTNAPPQASAQKTPINATKSDASDVSVQEAQDSFLARLLRARDPLAAPAPSGSTGLHHFPPLRPLSPSNLLAVPRAPRPTPRYPAHRRRDDMIRAASCSGLGSMLDGMQSARMPCRGLVTNKIESTDGTSRSLQPNSWQVGAISTTKKNRIQSRGHGLPSPVSRPSVSPDWRVQNVLALPLWLESMKEGRV